MPTKSRRVEFYRLTISGLAEALSYEEFLSALRARRRLRTLARKINEKTHAVRDVEATRRGLRLRFLSFARGFRPDILDTNLYDVTPNPLRPEQTGVDWTHALGRRVDDRYLLAVERVQTGIWPTTMERYLQWLVDEFSTEDQRLARDEKIVVTLEAVPGEQFLTELDSFDRISEAQIRKVRPNPGWKDLDNELGELAQESDGQKAYVGVKAKPRSSLNHRAGIVQLIRNLFRAHELDHATVRGTVGGAEKTLTTDKTLLYTNVQIELDDRGQVIEIDARAQLENAFDRAL